MSTVKYFHSRMPGAPVLDGSAGTLIGVLDACLVNGFGLTVIDTLVVSGGIATASMSLGHSFEPDTTAQISGTSIPALNGEHRVLTTALNTITFSTTAPDGSATGTMSAKLAPSGWEKVFSGTNLAAYRSQNVESTRMFLRVDDTIAKDTRVVGYETMTGVDTGMGAFPTSQQQSGGLFWPKASDTTGVARPWTIIADDRTFWYWVHTHPTPSVHGLNGATYGFGDFANFKAGDAYSCCLMGGISTGVTYSGNVNTALAYVTTAGLFTSSGCFSPRSWMGFGSSIKLDKIGGAFAVASAFSGTAATGHLGYPHGPNNSLVLTPMFLREDGPMSIRGVVRGATFSPQSFGTGTFNWLTKIDGQGAYAGRKLMSLKGASPYASADTDVTQFFDITGPWE